MKTSGISHLPYLVLDRRRFLAAASGLVAAGLLPARALALAGPHTFKQGALDITVVSDGNLVFPTAILAPQAPPEELKKLLEAAGITGAEVKAETNVTLIRSGSDVILFDTGSGPKFQPTAGKLAESLAAAGVEPGSVTKIVFTHAHPDHIWGTLDANGSPIFPNAAYYAAAAEWDFWMDKERAGKMPAEMLPLVTGAQTTLTAVKEKVTMVKPGDEIHAGIRVVDTPGHTPGHVSFEVPGDETLIVAGDVIVPASIGFPHPEWHFGFDSIPDLAVESRSKLLDRAATDKVKLLGFHWPYPGLAYAEKKATAYVYVPAA